MQVIVLGMHRSGTSLTTNLLHLLGFHVGDAEELIGHDPHDPNPENPKGFWERHDVVEINDRILQHFDCRWHELSHWPFDGLSYDADLPADITDAMQTVIDRLNRHPHCVIKDPRLCLTAHWWLERMDNPFIVTTYRDPLEIALSLHTRNQISIVEALALWEIYSISMLNIAAGHSCAHSVYQEIIEQPDQALSAIADAIQIDTQEGLSLPDKETIHAAVEPSLYRSKTERMERNHFVHSGQLPLLDACSHKTDYTPQTIPPLAKHTTAGTLPGITLAAAEEELGRARITIDEMISQIQTLERKEKEYLSQIDDLEEKNQTLEQEKQHQIDRLGAAEAELKAIKSTSLWKLRSAVIGEKAE